MSTAEALEVGGLRLRLGGRLIVDGFDLRLARGEVHGLIGANGAGKTSVLRLLAGLLPAEAGRGRVLGFDLRREPRRVAAAVGWLSQRAALHTELTVVETLRFRAEVFEIHDPNARVEALIDRFRLAAFRKVRVGRLSGGWARRVQLAAALTPAPRLLLLDEAAAGLDHEAQRDLWREIARSAVEGAAVLLGTHDPAEAERCDTLTVMSEGRIAARGSPSELVASSGLAVLLARGDAADLEAWRTRLAADDVEPWSGGLRLVATPADVDAAARAAVASALTVERQALRLEHVWPRLVRGVEARETA